MLGRIEAVRLRCLFVIEILDLHDDFSANELITYEALVLCGEGKAGELIDARADTYGGKVVVNPSGWLISKGHPLGATGLAQCLELYWQVRGQADKRQVKDAKIALQHNLGRGGAAVVTMYPKAQLGRADDRCTAGARRRSRARRRAERHVSRRASPRDLAAASVAGRSGIGELAHRAHLLICEDRLLSGELLDHCREPCCGGFDRAHGRGRQARRGRATYAGSKRRGPTCSASSKRLPRWPSCAVTLPRSAPAVDRGPPASRIPLRAPVDVSIRMM